MIERFDEKKKFCMEFELGGLENLYDCVTNKVFQYLEGKVEKWFWGLYSYTILPDWRIRELKERWKHKRFCTTCNITSNRGWIEWK
jgi:hypothetical protein